MGLLLDQQGKLKEAEPFYRRALEGRERAMGSDRRILVSRRRLEDSFGGHGEGEVRRREVM